MKVSLKYNSKSSGQYVPQANKLSESLEYEQEGKHYIVRFDDIDDPKLEKLYSYVSTLKGTAILLGNEEEISARDFFNVVKCESKLLCDGICKHGRIGNRS
ncbi:MAG: hypothetical protein BAJALOKI3v1_700027 [Promethearchaeota archaeon]|jgi:uncharacterized protein (UPF0128 family)|nr:MAG: hypothetical protein BAJALOKI3v1_700027 [Candidatus Lokiarchaeota archaeon]